MMTTDIKNKLKEKDYVIFDPVMTAELKAKVIGKDFFILDCSSNDSASWTEWEHLLTEGDKHNIGQGSIQHEPLEEKAFPDIFESFAGEKKSDTKTFYVRPGGGQAFYFDMLKPRRVSREVNQILQAVPLVQQNGLEYKGPLIEIEISHGDEKSHSQNFYAPSMRPRLTANELNQILGAEPFVVQIKGRKK